MAAKPKDANPEEISILPIATGRVTFSILGNSPLIYHRMAEKAKHELLFPSGRKTAHARASSLKHDPITEYRDSVYRDNGNNSPTRLTVPAPAFKGGMMTAALDMPDVKKTQVGRLVWVKGYSLHLYGVPKLFMATVRSADINRTPDIRTRAIVPEWACEVTVEFVMPQLSAKSVTHLMAAAGIVSGVGDFRQEKGKGNFGQFSIVNPDDATYQRIIQTGGWEPQDEALRHPEYYDDETRELMEWVTDKITARAA